MAPPVYFLHLARRQDRIESARANFDPDLWSDLRFIEGLDGSGSREQLLAELRAIGGRPCPEWVITNHSDPVLFRRPGTGEPYSGELGKLPVPYNYRWYTQQQTCGSIACGASHHRVWEAVARSVEPWAVILEDDQALPSIKRFHSFARDVESLDADFDIVYLFKMPSALLGDEAVNTSRNPRLRELRWQFGAQAYAISRNFARILVDLRLPRCLTVPDEFMNYAYNPHGHPRREQWRRCFGQPPPGRRAFVYDAPEPVVEHLAGSKVSDNDFRGDAKKDAAAKATVVWLEQNLREHQIQNIDSASLMGTEVVGVKTFGCIGLATSLVSFIVFGRHLWHRKICAHNRHFDVDDSWYEAWHEA